MLQQLARSIPSWGGEMVQAGEATLESYICFVNDGSGDKTWQVIEGLMGQSRAFRGVNLSRK